MSNEEFKIGDKVRFLPTSGPTEVGKIGKISNPSRSLKEKNKGLVYVTVTNMCSGFTSHMSQWVKPEHIEHCPEDGLDKHGLTWKYECCQSEDCAGKRITQTFKVSNEVWEKVNEGKHTSLCHPCFDEMAQRQGVSYTAKFHAQPAFTRTGETWEYGGLKDPTPGRAESFVICECGEGLAFVWDTNAEQDDRDDATCPKCDMLWKAPIRPKKHEPLNIFKVLNEELWSVNDHKERQKVVNRLMFDNIELPEAPKSVLVEIGEETYSVTGRYDLTLTTGGWRKVEEELPLTQDGYVWVSKGPGKEIYRVHIFLPPFITGEEDKDKSSPLKWETDTSFRPIKMYHYWRPYKVPAPPEQHKKEDT